MAGEGEGYEAQGGERFVSEAELEAGGSGDHAVALSLNKCRLCGSKSGFRIQDVEQRKAAGLETGPRKIKRLLRRRSGDVAAMASRAPPAETASAAASEKNLPIEGLRWRGRRSGNATDSEARSCIRAAVSLFVARLGRNCHPNLTLEHADKLARTTGL